MSIIKIESRGSQLLRRHLKKRKSMDNEPTTNKTNSLPDWITGRDPDYTYEVESTLMENGINHRRIFRKIKIDKPEPIIIKKAKKEKPFFIKIE